MQFDRNRLLIRQALASVGTDAIGRLEVDTKKAEELAALYLRAMRTVSDMQALPGLDSDAADQTLLAARMQYMQAFRAKWVSRVYINATKVRARDGPPVLGCRRW